MALDPQVDALLVQLAEAGVPSPESMTVARNRELIVQLGDLAGAPEDVARVVDTVAPGPAGDIPVRVHMPPATGR